ncbi:MAG TPA: hypothetical protein VML55_10455, partial [Planctomycetaceae bacterium]|nr:hypothetical protein [Planctomycetaceae bacterium]
MAFPAATLWLTALVLTSLARVLFAQPAPEADAARLSEKLERLQTRVAALREDRRADAEAARRGFDPRPFADVEVCAKAAEWILRHGEFYRPAYVGYADRALDLGLARLAELQQGNPGWLNRPGTTVLGYVSKIDGSVQPYALTLPEGIEPQAATRWPLYVKLHGRAAQMNEVD